MMHTLERHRLRKWRDSLEVATAAPLWPKEKNKDRAADDAPQVSAAPTRRVTCSTHRGSSVGAHVAWLVPEGLAGVAANDNEGLPAAQVARRQTMDAVI
jgi:hypothetical protein